MNYKKYYYIRIEYDLIIDKSRQKNINNKSNSNFKSNSKSNSKRKSNNNNKSKKDINKDNKSNKKRLRRNSSESLSKTYVTYIAKTINLSIRQTLNYVYSQHFTLSRNVFIEYRSLNLNKNNIRFIKRIMSTLTPIDINKIYINIYINGRKRILILSNVLYILDLLLNLISQNQLIRNTTLIRLIQNDIKIRNRSITAQLQDNNLYYLRL